MEAAAIILLASLPREGSAVVLVALSLGVFVLIGVAEITMGLAIGKERFVRTPAANASEYLGLSNAAIGLSGAAGSLMGGVLPGWLGGVDHGTGLRWAFALQALVLFIIAGGLAFASRSTTV
jgi:hypothetical protein